MHRHTISVLVNDQPGVLHRVAGLFGRRGFNIESITVGGSEEPGYSRMVIVTSGDDALLHQVSNQLSKLVEVIEVAQLSTTPMVARELALVKVVSEPAKRPEILALVEAFRASIVDVAPRSLTIQVVGETDKTDALIELLKPYGIRELCRTGVTAVARGSDE